MIPTAEEFLDKLAYLGGDDIFGGVVDAMIEFAKLHVQEALKQASEKAEVYVVDYNDYDVDKESILNAYPLTNIK